MEKFFIVATPIGNLEDMGMRALRVLKESDAIICERPTHTLKLLSHFNITGKKLVSYTEANKTRAIPAILKLLETQSCAFVVDAGTIGVSDPGPELVAAVRERGIGIESIPGPSALTSAIALAGERMNDVRFVGFFPMKLKERTALLTELKHGQYLAFYEAPHRIRKTMEFLQTAAPQCHAILASEISKVHEKIIAGNPASVLDAFSRDARLEKGEFVVFVRNS